MQNQPTSIYQQVDQLLEQFLISAPFSEKKTIFNHLNQQIEIQVQKQKEYINQLGEFRHLIQLYSENIMNNLKGSIENFQELKQVFTKQLNDQNIDNEYLKLLKIFKQLNNSLFQQVQELKQGTQKFDSFFEKIYQEFQSPIEKQIETTNINKTQIQEVKYKQQNFKYELLEQSTISMPKICWSFAFNQNATQLMVGCDCEIIVYQFENGQLKKEIQRMKDHSSFVLCLLFMNKSNQFVSGSQDCQLILWSQNSNQRWVVQSKLREHKGLINCIVIDELESLLVSGSGDESIKIWIKTNNKDWFLKSSIEAKFNIHSLSLNESGTKLITCGSKNLILVIQLQNNFQWKIVQTIEVKDFGYRLLFIDDNRFVFQAENDVFLDLFQKNEQNDEYEKNSSILLGNYKDCYNYFPPQIIKSKGILLVKQGQNLNFFTLKKNLEIVLEQQINLYDRRIFGRLSNDGEFLITWNWKKQIEVRKLKFQSQIK